MLQIDITPFASDALEDAMRLAQVKALNSFTFSDCLNFLNYAWSDIYNRMASIDDGYYGTNMRITQKLTKLPPFVKNTLQVYRAQSPVAHNRDIYREAGNTDLVASGTYKISGSDLYCDDALRYNMWLYFVPACKQLFFTHHNRDPKIHEDGHTAVRNNIYGLYELQGYRVVNNVKLYVDFKDPEEDIKKITGWQMMHRRTHETEDITEKFKIELSDEDNGDWIISFISCDFPYIFITYEHTVTGEHVSGFFTRDMEFNRYNPFDFTGRNSDVEYVECKWNDKTGMGVVIKDFNDLDSDGSPKVKELGWTPDSVLKYPKPEMYRYLVARLADKFAALNESNIMGVQRELIEAQYAFEAFFDTDKSAWKKINNVNSGGISDWL